jgi:hypothetical protein
MNVEPKVTKVNGEIPTRRLASAVATALAAGVLVIAGLVAACALSRPGPGPAKARASGAF